MRHRHPAIARLILTALVLAGLFGIAGESRADDPAAAIVAARAKIARDFSGPIEACVARNDTGHPIFHGCVDWHSSVHGHWALVAIARATGDDALLAAVTRLLDPKKLAAERRTLARNPRFEMPYGRAWFLRLAIEFDEATGDKRLEPMADDVAGSLLDYFRARGFDPLDGSYRSGSWALINLRAYGVHRGRADIVAFVDGIVTRALAHAEGPCPFDLDAREGSFMAICTNWAWLVGESVGGDAGGAAIRRILPPDAAMAPVARPRTAHLYGLDFSRAWGLWHVWKRTGEPAYRAAYARHFSRGYRERNWWAGAYRVVGHWVSQFGALAVMPLFGQDLR